MSDFLKKIQEQPEEKRKTIFWLAVVVLGLAFFSFWIYLVGRRVSGLNREELYKSFKVPDFGQDMKKLPEVTLPSPSQAISPSPSVSP